MTTNGRTIAHTKLHFNIRRIQLSICLVVVVAMSSTALWWSELMAHALARQFLRHSESTSHSSWNITIVSNENRFAATNRVCFELHAALYSVNRRVRCTVHSSAYIDWVRVRLKMIAFFHNYIFNSWKIIFEWQRPFSEKKREAKRIA